MSNSFRAIHSRISPTSSSLPPPPKARQFLFFSIQGTPISVPFLPFVIFYSSPPDPFYSLSWIPHKVPLPVWPWFSRLLCPVPCEVFMSPLLFLFFPFPGRYSSQHLCPHPPCFFFSALFSRFVHKDPLLVFGPADTPPLLPFALPRYVAPLRVLSPKTCGERISARFPRARPMARFPCAIPQAKPAGMPDEVSSPSVQSCLVR